MAEKGQTVINVAGDYVEEKHVMHEVNNVETGGVGIQNVYNNAPEQPLPSAQTTPIDQAPTSIPEADLFKYIHYDIDDDKERVRVHKAICHIVKLPKMQHVIDALKELMDNKRIMRTIKQDAMLAELRRLGLPDGSTTGFSDNNFFSAYKHIVG